MFCVFLMTVCEEEGLEKVRERGREEIVTVFVYMLELNE